LRGVTPEQIRDGLEALTTRKDTWPPNAVEFRQLCMPSTVSPDGVNSSAYISFTDKSHPEHEVYGGTKRIENDSYKVRKRKSGNEAIKKLREGL
jgi:hypothetical protein